MPVKASLFFQQFTHSSGRHTPTLLRLPDRVVAVGVATLRIAVLLGMHRPALVRMMASCSSSHYRTPFTLAPRRHGSACWRRDMGIKGSPQGGQAPDFWQVSGLPLVAFTSGLRATEMLDMNMCARGAGDALVASSSHEDKPTAESVPARVVLQN